MMNIEKIEFFNLKEKIEYIEEVSYLYWKEWSEEHGDTVERGTI